MWQCSCSIGTGRTRNSLILDLKMETFLSGALEFFLCSEIRRAFASFFALAVIIRILYSNHNAMSLGQTLSNCLLLGPAYLPVQQLALQPAIQSAVTNLIEQLNSAVNSQSSPWGPFQVNETFFSAGMFEVNTPDLIFQYDWNVPGGVALASGSKPTTDNNTIYRIGSISKVFTVYTQLLEKGTSFWSEPITRYIPEIAQAAANQSLSNPVQYPDWQDITIGELASQLADIGRGGTVEV